MRGMRMYFDIKIGECMTKGVHTLDVSKSVLDAAKLLKQKQVGSIIVTEKSKAVGIITERDIIYKIVCAQKDAKKTRLKDAMSKTLKSIGVNQTVQDAALAMKENNIKRLPVLDKKNKLVGIVSEGDLLRVYPGIVDILSESPSIKQPDDIA
jgi:CBS domain-containing protein